MPVFWLGLICAVLFRRRPSLCVFTGRRVRAAADESVAVVRASASALVRAGGALHRLLWAGAARNILDTINEDYVRTAKAKGLLGEDRAREARAPHSLIPIVTLFGLDFAAVIGGGAILTETVFDLHGVGQYAAQSINNFDLPPIMGVTIYGAFFIVLFSVLVDLFYAISTHRIRPT